MVTSMVPPGEMVSPIVTPEWAGCHTTPLRDPNETDMFH